jgi:AraC-like DNA-binding protein
MDRLSSLFTHFSVKAGLFHSGGYCGNDALIQGDVGYLHVLHSGKLTVIFEDGTQQRFTEPTVIFLPRPSPHRFIASAEDQPQLACASLRFEGGSSNPIATAFPRWVCVSLEELAPLKAILDGLFSEAFAEYCGRAAAVERWFELLIINLLRYFLNNRPFTTGMLAGLADKRLARALHHVHSEPGGDWTLDKLSEAAGMSRARFASHFQEVVGQTVGAYMLNFRISLAQKALRSGRPMKHIAAEVGYETPSALARAFRRHTQLSPGEWLALESVGAGATVDTAAASTAA